MKKIFASVLLGLSLFGCNQSSDFQAITKEINQIDGSSSPLPKNINLRPVTQTFTQTDIKKLDIVWVVDNSGSMLDEQTALAANFELFIQSFVEKEVDFKMAITTTDPTSTICGKMVSQSDTLLNAAAAATDRLKFIQDFKKLVLVGTSGSGKEQGLLAGKCFLEKNPLFNNRSDAHLVYVMISDEEDQSPDTVENYVNTFKSAKAKPEHVRVYSIVDMDHMTAPTTGVTVGHERYAKASQLTNGTTANIKHNFSDVLLGISDSIMELLDSYQLTSVPIDGSLKVYVNNIQVSGYELNDKAIKFNPNAIPPVGASIRVEYQVAE